MAVAFLKFEWIHLKIVSGGLKTKCRIQMMDFF